MYYAGVALDFLKEMVKFCGKNYCARNHEEWDWEIIVYIYL